jgi:hypothetical protein
MSPAALPEVHKVKIVVAAHKLEMKKRGGRCKKNGKTKERTRAIREMM